MFEPISPELVLICPELRATALAALGEAPRSVSAAAPRPVSAAIAQAPQPVLMQIVVYAAWQMLMSALTALAAVATVSVSVLAIGLIVH